MTTQHIVFEANMTRYNIVITEFRHRLFNTDVCMFVWLTRGKGGKALVWDKGDRIYQSYASEKSGFKKIAFSIMTSEVYNMLSAGRSNKSGNFKFSSIRLSPSIFVSS